MTLLPMANAVRFHVSLNVSSIQRSVEFYRRLFGMEPAKLRDDYAKFEPNSPPLVLSLEPNGRVGGGTLNHLGVRMSDERQLVALQERLEREGIRSTREEGVECCYAKQTKFWVHDPDMTLWEFYTLDEDDLAHRGKGQSLDVMLSSTLPNESKVWEHNLGCEFPANIDAATDSIDLVTMRGTFNVPLSTESQLAVIAEARRILRPQGRIFLRILTGDKTHPSPTLSGPASRVKYVPAKDDIVAAISQAGFTGIRLLKYDAKPCFVVDGVQMRETHIEAFKPA